MNEDAKQNLLEALEQFMADWHEEDMVRFELTHEETRYLVELILADQEQG